MNKSRRKSRNGRKSQQENICAFRHFRHVSNDNYMNNYTAIHVNNKHEWL